VIEQVAARSFAVAELAIVLRVEDGNRSASRPICLFWHFSHYRAQNRFRTAACPRSDAKMRVASSY